MEEQEETLSEKTLSDEEFNPNQFEYVCEGEVEDDGDEWESVSQVSGASESSISSSSVWIYFDKNPALAPGYNVCKKCSKKYQLSTSVTSLRKHLKTHQLKAPTRTEKIEKKNEFPLSPFSKREQDQHDKYLIQWLIRDLQPFTVVDNSSFRAFVGFLCSRYSIPDRHKAKGIIDLLLISIFFNNI